MAVVCIGPYIECGESSRGVAPAAMLELSGLSEVLKSNPGLSVGSSWRMGLITHCVALASLKLGL